MGNKTFRPRVSQAEMDLIIRHRDPQLHKGGTQLDKGNVLIIGDIHEPFCLDGYLSFCMSVRSKYNCGTVVFIGDIIDNHYSSYHEQDPDGMGGGDELEHAITKIHRWYEAFPEAYVVIGNHDRIVQRKAYSAGVSSRWVREYHEVLGTPKWKFVEEVELDGVVYVHGEGGTARSRIKQEMQSIVQGHLHSQAYLEWCVGSRERVFAMQVGCGIDRKSYAMAYGKAGKKPIIGCGVVLDGGKTPISLLMDLI